MAKSQHRGERRTGQFFLASGALALLVAALARPEWLGHLSANGVLSLPSISKVQAVRLLLLLMSGVLLAAGMSRRAGLRGALIGSGVWLAGALAIIQQAYPNQLFFRPRLLLRTALGEEVLLRDYDPRSHLVAPSHEVLRSRYPAINIHAHLSYSAHRTPEEVADIMDRCNIQAVVDLDGPLLDTELRQELQQYAGYQPGRLIIFSNFWFSAVIDKWGHWRQVVDELDEAKRLGARGIKIWKNLGLKTRDEHSQLIPVDDLRLEPLWNKAAELQLPILIHLADPPQNFEPLDRHNESLEYLTADAAISYQGTGVPRPEVVLAQFEQVLERHPNVTFIAAHLAAEAHNLHAAAQMLDRHPNLYMDIAARANDLGRQPVTAQAFVIRYADRLLFGTDGNPDDKVYRGYFRLLETADEYFDDPAWPEFNFGRWKLYGLNLPEEVLRKLYHDNAAKVLGLPLLSERKG